MSDLTERLRKMAMNLTTSPISSALFEAEERIQELEQKLRTTSLEALAISDTNNEMAVRVAEAEKDYHEERKARYAAQSQVEYLSNALAGMLDVWSGYPMPECDAAISAMQLVGIDRWSAQAALGSDITSDDLIEAAGLTK